MVNPAELPKGIGRLNQVGGLPSGFGPTRNQHEGIHENALRIAFASDSLQTENFSNRYRRGEFLIDQLSSPAARMIWGKIPSK